MAEKFWQISLATLRQKSYSGAFHIPPISLTIRGGGGGQGANPGENSFMLEEELFGQYSLSVKWTAFLLAQHKKTYGPISLQLHLEVILVKFCTIDYPIPVQRQNSSAA